MSAGTRRVYEVADVEGDDDILDRVLDDDVIPPATENEAETAQRLNEQRERELRNR
jgi:hypothetical protein